MSFTIPFFKLGNVHDVLEEFGVVVITDVFSNKECDMFVSNLVSEFCSISELDLADIKNTWIPENLPPQTRPGMFQALVSNLPTVVRVRTDDRIEKIFNSCYSYFRDDTDIEYIVSADGINLKPGTIGPFQHAKSRDWAHIDQSNQSLAHNYCIQGQAVLTNTTASFVASPKSHLIYQEILTQEDPQHINKSNFCKIKNINAAQDLLTSIGGEWQIPIIAPKGSFIIWYSTTIHSAKLQDGAIDPLTNGPFYGWRCVLYISYRPKTDFKESQLRKKIQYALKNRTLNHWGTKVFKKDPSHSRFNQVTYVDSVAKLVENPELVYNIYPLTLAPYQKKLYGF